MPGSAEMLPSTLKYKDRLRMQGEDPYEYNTLYTSTTSLPVWQRLTTDASIRKQRTQALPAFKEGSNAQYSAGTLSGYMSNNNPAVVNKTTFKSGYIQEGLPVESLHPITARRYKQKYPLDFMASIRPDAETTNQTMRMLGTYEVDYAHTQRMGTFIASGCPGGKGFFHPDVTVGTARPAR